MTAHITAPALTVRIRADIDASTARDLAASLQLDGWEATGMTVPRTGSPEVTFPLIGALPTLHRLTRSLPRLLETWRVHHGLDAYEVVVSKAGDEATRTVIHPDRDGMAAQALIAAIAELIGADPGDRPVSTG